jgi:hypothetical protein
MTATRSEPSTSTWPWRERKSAQAPVSMIRSPSISTAPSSITVSLSAITQRPRTSFRWPFFSIMGLSPGLGSHEQSLELMERPFLV